MSKEKKSKKGLIIGIVAVVVVIAAVGGSSGSKKKDDSSKNEIVSVNTESKSSKKKNVERDSDKTATKDTSMSISEQILWEVDGLKLSATGINEDSFYGAAIKVLAENNSDKDVGIGADAVIVNDYMINDLTSITVTSGNKANDEITLFSSELEAAGIEHIGKVELYLHTFDPDTFETLQSSDCITIQTSEYDKMDTQTDIDGAILYDEGGIKIMCKYVDENSFWGSAVLMYVENNTDQNIIVQCDDVSVNGFMVSALMSTDVYSGKKAIDDITILQSSLEDNGIDSIDTIETSFKILNENFEEIANSGKVSFSTK